MTTTTCQARLGCLVGRLDAQRQRRPPSRVRGASRFASGRGLRRPLPYPLGHGAAAKQPISTHDRETRIKQKSSSVRQVPISKIFHNEKHIPSCVRHAREQSLGNAYKTLCNYGHGRTRPCHPSPRTRAQCPLGKRGRCGATDRFCANTHTHTRTHRDKRKACCTQRAQNIARQLKSRREDAPEQVAVFSECYLAASPPCSCSFVAASAAAPPFVRLVGGASRELGGSEGVCVCVRARVRVRVRVRVRARL